MSACTQSGCGGTVLADGYCDTCGYAATSQPASPAAPSAGSAPSAHAVPSTPPPPSAAAHQIAPDISLVGNVCTEAGCGGTILADGYCNTCGLAAKATPAPPPPDSSSGAPTGDSTPTISVAAPTAPVLSARQGGAAGSSASRRTSATRRATRAVTGLGLGLVDVAPTPVGDPAMAVMSDEKIARVLGEVPEDDRYCSSCGKPVGRSIGGEAGRVKGYCGSCRTEFNFVTNAPTLAPGEMVANQYRILGPIAHGGMGWIYLGQDTAVSNRWVVLKGLLNEDDQDAVLSAVAERQFLAQIEHARIVNIYNFSTHGGRGYIVMEYVGGESLNDKLKARRMANGGAPDPLPLADAIAYLLGVLPAIGYLHRLGLVYNDLKPANMMATADDVKLIDVGGVMRIDDDDAAIFGTQGFQAPEVAQAGPSIASDLYTVGRTLAVSTLNFVFHRDPWVHAIPPAAEQPLLARHESYHRFLLKATAFHPDDRFQTADEMQEQLRGVLREVVAMESSTPRPGQSAVFERDRLADLLAQDSTASAAPLWESLPRPKVTSNDAAAAFLENLPNEPHEAMDALVNAVQSAAVPWTIEGATVNATLLVELGHDPSTMLTGIAEIDPWDWRITWIRALRQFDLGNFAEAAEFFSHVWTQLPGELAPKLGVALSAESLGAYDRAAGLYQQIMSTDPSYVTASFGLARCRVASGDRAGAVSAYTGVPVSSAGYFDAQLASARTLTSEVGGSQPNADNIAAAAATVERLQLDNVERSRIATGILEQALQGMQSGQLKESPKRSLFGEPMTEDGLRRGLERTYRELARVATTSAERHALVDKANDVRPFSLL